MPASLVNSSSTLELGTPPLQKGTSLKSLTSTKHQVFVNALSNQHAETKKKNARAGPNLELVSQHLLIAAALLVLRYMGHRVSK